MTVVVTWRSRILAPVSLVLQVAALVSPSRVWTSLLVVAAGTLVVAAWWAWQLARQVEVSRELRLAWMQVGGHIEESFTLVNRAPVPALWVEVVDYSNLPGYSASTVRAAGGRETVRWSARGFCGRRGEYQLGPWEVRLGDPFGLFLITLSFAAAEDVLIYPPVARWPLPALSGGVALGHASARARARQST